MFMMPQYNYCDIYMNISRSEEEQSYQQLTREQLLQELQNKERRIQALQHSERKDGGEALVYRKKLEEQFEQIQNLIIIFEEINQAVQKITSKLSSLSLSMGEPVNSRKSMKKQKYQKNLQIIDQKDVQFLESLIEDEGSVLQIGKDTINSLNQLQNQVNQIIRKFESEASSKKLTSKESSISELQQEIEEYRSENKVMKQLINTMQNDYFKLVKQISECRKSDNHEELQNMSKEGLVHMSRLLLFSIKELEKQKSEMIKNHIKEKEDEKVKYTNILDLLKKQKIPLKK